MTGYATVTVLYYNKVLRFSGVLGVLRVREILENLEHLEHLENRKS